MLTPRAVALGPFHQPCEAARRPLPDTASRPVTSAPRRGAPAPEAASPTWEARGGGAPGPPAVSRTRRQAGGCWSGGGEGLGVSGGLGLGVGMGGEGL